MSVFCNLTYFHKYQYPHQYDWDVFKFNRLEIKSTEQNNLEVDISKDQNTDQNKSIFADISDSITVYMTQHSTLR